MTFYVCFGKYAGFNFEWDRRTKRILLGIVSIALINQDIEVMLDSLVSKLEDSLPK